MKIVKSLFNQQTSPDPYFNVVSHLGKDYVVCIFENNRGFNQVQMKENFDRNYKSEKRRLTRSSKPKKEDVRKTPEFREWVKKKFPPGTIFKMLGTRGSPWREVEAYGSDVISGYILQTSRKTKDFYRFGMSVNGIDKITAVKVGDKIESILELYKEERASQ